MIVMTMPQPAFPSSVFQTRTQARVRRTCEPVISDWYLVICNPQLILMTESGGSAMHLNRQDIFWKVKPEKVTPHGAPV